MVMAHCLFQTLKSRQVDPAITLAAPPATARLAHRMPEIDEIVETPFQHGRLHITDRFRIGRSLRGHRFDQAIILPGSLKAALLPFFAKIPIRTGYRGESRWGLINDPRPRPSTKEDPMAARFVQLGLAANAPAVSTYPHPHPRHPSRQCAAGLPANRQEALHRSPPSQSVPARNSAPPSVGQNIILLPWLIIF